MFRKIPVLNPKYAPDTQYCTDAEATAHAAMLIGKVLYNHMEHTEQDLRAIAEGFYPWGNQKGRALKIWQRELDCQLALMFPPKPVLPPEDLAQTKLFEVSDGDI